MCVCMYVCMCVRTISQCVSIRRPSTDDNNNSIYKNDTSYYFIFLYKYCIVSSLYYI